MMRITPAYFLLILLLFLGCDPEPRQESYTPANFRYAITTHEMIGDSLWALSFRSQLIDGPIYSWINQTPMSLFQEGERLWTADTLINPTDQLEYRYQWRNATLDASINLPKHPYPTNVRVNEIPMELDSPTLFNEADSCHVTWTLNYPLTLLNEEPDGMQEQRTVDVYWNASGDTASSRTADSSALFFADEGDTVSFSFYLFAFERRLYSGVGNDHRDPTIYSWFFFEAWSDTFRFRVRPRPDTTATTQ